MFRLPIPFQTLPLPTKMTKIFGNFLQMLARDKTTKPKTRKADYYYYSYEGVSKNIRTESIKK
jgi:hypothetical protein